MMRGAAAGGGYDGAVSASSDKAQQILEELARAPREKGPVRLDPRYLEAIDRLEQSEVGRSGADKTWVLTTARRSRTLLANARRVR
jgi:hypothetical protein